MYILNHRCVVRCDNFSSIFNLLYPESTFSLIEYDFILHLKISIKVLISLCLHLSSIEMVSIYHVLQRETLIIKITDFGIHLLDILQRFRSTDLANETSKFRYIFWTENFYYPSHVNLTQPRMFMKY